MEGLRHNVRFQRRRVLKSNFLHSNDLKTIHLL